MPSALLSRGKAKRAVALLPLLMLVVTVLRHGTQAEERTQQPQGGAMDVSVSAGTGAGAGGRSLLLTADDFTKAELDKLDSRDPQYIMDSFLSLMCVMVAGMAAGLTMGMLSADELELEIFLNGGGTPEQQASAERLMPVVQSGHQLLVTLLIVNSIANETLPIFMNRLMDWKMAIVFSATAVLFVGEIIPSAVFSGPHKLALSAYLVPVVRVAMLVFCPVAWPLAKVLDCVLGAPEGPTSRFNRLQLQTIIRLHQVREFKAENAEAEGMPASSLLSAQPKEFNQDSGLRTSEVKMIENALTIGARTVGQAMTPYELMQTVASDTRLDAKAIARIVKLAHSRIPVYEGAPHNVRSVLMMRKLILTDTTVAPMISLLPQRQPLVVEPSTNLIDMLNEFQLARSHFALVVSDVNKVRRRWGLGTPLDEGDVLGLITCDDVLEELIGELADDEDLEREKVQMGMTPRKKSTFGIMEYMVTPSMLSTLAPPLLQPVEPVESATFTSTATSPGEKRAADRMKEDVETMLLEANDDPSAALKANLKDPLILHAMEEAQITQLERAVEKAADARDDRISTRSDNSADGASRRRGSSDTGTGGTRRPRASLLSFQEVA